jgi:hypothetical protein
MSTPQPKSDPLVDLRVNLIENGYRYVPVKGKGPKITGWPNFPQDIADVARKARQHSDHPSTGILTGEVVAVDIDAPDPATAEKLIERLLQIPGASSAPCRTGRAPKCLFVFRTADPRKKRSTPFYIVSGQEHQIEVLGVGQQFVAFGDHAGTGKPYTWMGGDPLTVPAADLPVIGHDAVDSYLKDAEAILAAAGTPKKEKAAQRPSKPAGDSFWQRVNSAALAHPEAWVRSLFPGAHKEAGTGAWRVSSKELGRNLEEDISIHGDGVRDFGEEKPSTPIQLVVDYGGAASPKDAALWLCDRMGIDPTSLGWEQRQPVAMRFGGASVPPVADNDDEPPELIDTKLPDLLQRDKKLADFTHPGGLVEELVDWIVSSSPTPSRELALGAVLAFLAALIGRRYSTGQRDTRANSYIVALAPSGYGKDHSRQQIKRLGEAADGFLDAYFGPERVMSASALRNALERWPSIVCFMDEFGGFMRDILDKRAGEHKRAISTDLRDYFSASNTNFAGAEYAQAKAVRIYNPNLNLYGTATPGQFWNALSNASAEDGLLPRMLLFNVGGDWPDVVDPTRDVRDVPRHFLDRLLSLAGVQPKVDDKRSLGMILDSAAKVGGKKPLDPIIVHWTDDAEAAMKLFTEQCRNTARDATDLRAPFINRIAEHAIKLALILAVASSTRQKRALIDMARWEWAKGLASHCVSEMVECVEEYVSDSEREELFKAVASIIQKFGKDGATRGVIIDRLPKKFSRTMREEVLDDLVEAGRVVAHTEEPKGGAGRRKTRLIWRG